MEHLQRNRLSEIIESLPRRIINCRWFEVLFAMLAASGLAIAFESLKTTFPVIANSFSYNRAASPLDEITAVPSPCMVLLFICFATFLARLNLWS